MNNKLQALFFSILASGSDGKGLSGVNISRQFKSDDGLGAGAVRKANAAFLIMLMGDSHPDSREAKEYLTGCADEYAGFLMQGLAAINKETEHLLQSGPSFEANLARAIEYCTSGNPLEWNDEARKKIWSVFFPEGVGCIDDREKGVERLRKKRTVEITQLNKAPISDPAKELLFTSNILITVPSSEQSLLNAGLPRELTDKIREVCSEKQLFWFDHPVQIGVETDKNEIIYGLRGLDEACAFEKKRGNMNEDAKAVCLLSASVTHDGLRDLAQSYLVAELAKIEPFEHLDVYVFSERDTDRLVDDVLVPAAEKYLPGTDAGDLREVFGVDGEYGRHYTFLKAITALWQVAMDPRVRATFKIDLDQVFPQEVLAGTTGGSAFDHFMSPLWGALGKDADDNDVELGMIAGALVNEDDIDESLYKLDVPFPESIPGGEGVFFASKLPMAFSTAAEMGTRYGTDGIDGITSCIQRVHVTGGTNGILIDSLRKYRPFTPTFIGRAEDQAYLMSVLYDGNGGYLRYVHRDGLIMRHDKHAFAGEAIKAAALGRVAGDLVRIMVFSKYAECLPWPAEKTKSALDPFTGCFISRLPVTLVFLRLCVAMAEMFEKGEDDEAAALAGMVIQRLSGLILKSDIPARYGKERAAWNIYYNVLDALEADTGSRFLSSAKEIISGCRLRP